MWELVTEDEGGTYRCVYTLKVAGKVTVLHAFQKKSKSGISTPRENLDKVKSRLKGVIAAENQAGKGRTK